MTFWLRGSASMKVPPWKNSLPAAICPNLSEKETAVLLLHLCFGFSFREIAELTSIPRSSLHDIYAAALRKARDTLEKK